MTYGLPVADDNRRWTQTDVNDLRARAQAGESIVDVAQALSRTEDGVRRMAVRLALTFAPR